METLLLTFIVGAIIGTFATQVALFIWYDEIMRAMDRLYNWVQRLKHR